MSFAFKTLLCSSLTMLGCLQAAHSNEICSRAAPPLDSALSTSHGSVVFIYPRSIEHGFSGCQKMWGPTGDLLVKLRFVKGALVLAEFFDQARTEAAVSCQYRDGKLVTDFEDCPAYEDGAAGMKTLPLDAERRIIPSIPQDRDPRK
jgi:hypothetical protein